MSSILSSCCRSIGCLARTALPAATAASSSLLRPQLTQAPTAAMAAVSAASAALRLQHQVNQVRSYQVRASIKPRCEHCYMVLRKGRRYILCKKVARHKQRQG